MAGEQADEASRKEAGELMRILTREGVLDIEVTDPYERSIVGSYWNYVRLFLEGKESELPWWWREEEVRVAGHLLEVEPDWIEHWAHAGDLEFEDIYAIR